MLLKSVIADVEVIEFVTLRTVTDYILFCEHNYFVN